MRISALSRAALATSGLLVGDTAPPQTRYGSGRTHRRQQPRDARVTAPTLRPPCGPPGRNRSSRAMRFGKGGLGLEGLQGSQTPLGCRRCGPRRPRSTRMWLLGEPTAVLIPTPAPTPRQRRSHDQRYAVDLVGSEHRFRCSYNGENNRPQTFLILTSLGQAPPARKMRPHVSSPTVWGVAARLSATGYIYSSEVYPEIPAGLVLVGVLLLTIGPVAGVAGAPELRSIADLQPPAINLSDHGHQRFPGTGRPRTTRRRVMRCGQPPRGR